MSPSEVEWVGGKVADCSATTATILERSMSKVLTADLDRNYTQAVIQDMELHLDVYLEMMGCEPLAARFPVTTVAIQADGQPDDYFESGSMIIVSGQLKAQLIEMDAHAEFIQLRIVMDGAEYTGQEFYFCHILDCVDCFNYEYGVCTFHKKPGFTTRIDTIERLAIDEVKAAPHAIFRLANGAEHIVCVSDAVGARLLRSGLRGMKIIAPEDWFFGC